MSDKDKKPGIIKRISSNRDIKLGLIFLALALIFAFASITQEVKTSKNSDELRLAGREHWYPLDRKNEELSAEIFVEYNTSGNISETATVYFGKVENDDLNNPKEVFEKYLNANESRSDNNVTLDLKNDHDYINCMWADFPANENSTNENVTIDFTLKIKYLSQPYSLLTFPAMFFTLAGVVFSLKGKSAILAGIGEEKKEEKMMKKMQDQDEEEMSRLQESRKEQGLQNRPEQERKDIKFMGVDFKGQDEEDEEK